VLAGGSGGGGRGSGEDDGVRRRCRKLSECEKLEASPVERPSCRPPAGDASSPLSSKRSEETCRSSETCLRGDCLGVCGDACGAVAGALQAPLRRWDKPGAGWPPEAA